MSSTIPVIGLTGGIASGKSTVASFFREAGIAVIDADMLGHMVLERGGTAYDAVIDEFGTGILGTDGYTIDRQLLGKQVFDNSDMRRRLEAITHPAIAELARRGIELVEQRGQAFVIYEAALLVETGIYKGLQALVVVSSAVELQLSRLCARDAMTPTAAAARIASQLPLSEKLAVADYIIENNETWDELRQEVGALSITLKSRFSDPAQ